MKRILLFSLAASSLLTISCRKQYSCVCTDGYDTFTEDLGITTKRRAENRCSLLTAAYAGYYTCTVK